MRDKLEQMIDEHGIHAVLKSVAEIAMDRALGISTKDRPDQFVSKGWWKLHSQLEHLIHC